MNRRQARLIPILLAVVALLAFPLNAGATTYNISGTVYRQQEVNYTADICLSVISNGANYQDTFSGILYMDVYW